jgi:hypothetical protein
MVIAETRLRIIREAESLLPWCNAIVVICTVSLNFVSCENGVTAGQYRTGVKARRLELQQASNHRVRCNENQPRAG